MVVEISRRPDDSWALEYTGDPDPRLLREAVQRIGADGGGRVVLWRSAADDAADEAAAAAGLRPTRDLLQMRRPLPLPPGSGRPVPLRPFVPGRDEEAWLEVNNRAFAWHPEQGGWDLETVKARESEPWFDAAGFLLHEIDGRLAGFCWTKVHRNTEPWLGEIYVIAVDPDFLGRGLGRDLTVAGLDHLAGRGLTVGMLYVDASNTPARTLYEHLGFTVDHVDRQYSGEV